MKQEQLLVQSRVEQEHWWFLARRKLLLRIVAEVVPDRRCALIADVGCGTGANTAALASQHPAIGLDVSSTAVALARQRFPGVRFVCGEARDVLAEEGGHVTFILLADVLEHVHDDFRMLSELLALAQPATFFLLTVPADMSLWSRHDESHRHYRRYSRERFERLWEKLPVTPLLVSHFNSRLYPFIKLARMVNRWRRKSCGEAGTDLAVPPRPLNWLLERIFVGEGKRLQKMLRGERVAGYSRGVSLIALLRRDEGEITPRAKPDDLVGDFFDPDIGGHQPSASHALPELEEAPT